LSALETWPIPFARPRAALRQRRAELTLAAEGVAVVAVTLACVVWALQLWRADLTVPLRYAPVDDTKFYVALVKGIIEHGWYLTNSSLGAPFGQQLYDFPQGADNLSLVLIRGLALVSSDPGLVLNLFFLVTFALVSLSAHLVLRRLGLTAPVAGVAAVLFSLLPYHFFRGESQLLLSAYYAVPLSCLLFIELLDSSPLFAGRRSLLTLTLCVVIGSANAYYATFALILIAGATIVAAAMRRWHTLRDGVLIIALVVAALVVNLAPTLVYQARHRSDPAVARTATADQRSPYALDLRVTNLVVPVPDNRIAPLRHLAASYDRAVAPAYCETCYASIGAVGTVGLGWLTICALAALAGGGGWFAARRLFGYAGVGVVIAAAAGTVGGLSSAFELLVTPEIRAWNRISVFIAFFSLLAVALLLDALTRRLRAGRAGPALAGLLLAAVLAFGVFEQTTAQDVPAYAADARQWRSDAVFVQQIEARMPAGASIFQLPYVPFPEGYPNTPIGGSVATYATKYEPLRGYLHSATLRWSYGAMKGRPADWSAELAAQPLSYLLAAVSAAGFDGVWLDPAGFEPTGATRIEAGLRSELGVAPLLSPDRDLWFFDLRPYRHRLERAQSVPELALLRERTLHPLRTACAPGGVALVNPSATAQAVTLTIPLSDGATVVRRLSLAPGRTFLPVAGGVRYSSVIDDRLARFESRTAAALIVGLTGPPCPR
jgi:hypothetical protein